MIQTCSYSEDTSRVGKSVQKWTAVRAMPVVAILEFDAWKPGDEVGAMVSLQEQENNKTFIYKTVLSDKTIPFLSLI